MIHTVNLLFICKFNMDNFQVPLKFTFLDKFLGTMLADYPEPIVNSFLVSCNIFLPLRLVRANHAEKQSVFILGWRMSIQLVNVKALPSLRYEFKRVTLERLARMCTECSNSVWLESADLANIQTCSVTFLMVDQISLRDRLKGTPFALKKVAFVKFSMWTLASSSSLYTLSHQLHLNALIFILRAFCINFDHG